MSSEETPTAAVTGSPSPSSDASDTSDKRDASDTDEKTDVNHTTNEGEAASEAQESDQPGTVPESEQKSASETEPPSKQTAEIDTRVTEQLTAALQGHVQVLATLQSPLTDQEQSLLMELGKSMPEAILQVSRNKSAGLSGDLLALARLVKAVSLLEERRPMLEEALGAVAKLDSKRTADIVNAQKLVRRLKSEIGWPLETPASESYHKLLEAEQTLDDIVSKNRDFQTELLGVTGKLVDELRSLLEAGNSTAAGALWDKIQANTRNLSSRAQTELKEQISELRTKINELQEWKKFAAAEKKKELISEMEKLRDLTLPAPEKAAQIRKLHEKWKLLGFSDQNEELWQHFKKTSDDAYAPCKEHFKQRKALMAENLRQREEICSRIENFLQTVDATAPRIVELKNFEKQLQEDWKKYAPIEQSKIKKLQKKYYGLLDQVRSIRNSAARTNGELKQALVVKARQLLELDDRREAMAQAKALQIEWKGIGPASFKDDRKYWEEFRAACDTLFKERDEAKNAHRNEIGSSLQACNDLLSKLEQILEQDDESLRESRKLFASLQRDFNQALSSKIKKERRQLLDRFTVLTRKIESRLRKLPDKKQLQALASLEAKATACLALETRLLACSDDEALSSEQHGFDKEAWSSLQNSGLTDFDQRMTQRLEALLGSRSVKALARLLEESEKLVRRQLIEAEIRANLDSPEQDRGMRMELQLSQLQNKFGKAVTEESGDRARFGREFQLALLCAGPLPDSVRKEMQQRAERVLEKLL